MTQPSPSNTAVPAQVSPDGRWWWDGAQWRPVDAPAPIPYVGAPAPVRAMQPHPPTRKQGRSTGATIAIVLGCAIGIPVLLSMIAAVAIPLFLNQQRVALEAAAEATVRDAMLAQANYVLDHESYTSNVLDLVDYGFVAEPGTTLEVTATGGGYCVASGPEGEPATAWGTQDGPTDVPCL